MLWDLVAFIDQATIDFINQKGGIKAIVISHPHFYTTHLEWARIFKCPVYMSADDAEWLNREDTNGVRKWIKGVQEIEEVGGEVKAIQCGGHFDGSAVLLWERKLCIADTFMSVPVSRGFLGLMYGVLMMVSSLGSIIKIGCRVR
jgi:glyoxylase-like metal-dependent hydrolase (beta-lactamase superfamily II)